VLEHMAQQEMLKKREKVYYFPIGKNTHTHTHKNNVIKIHMIV